MHSEDSTNPSPHGSYATETSVQHSPETFSPKETGKRLNDSDSAPDKESTKPDHVLNPDLVKGKWDMFAEADSFHATQHVCIIIILKCFSLDGILNYFLFRLLNQMVYPMEEICQRILL